MFTFAELRDLERRLQNRKVLSIFVDTSAINPTRRFGWRDELYRALTRLDVAASGLSSGERTARELCTAHLRTLLEGMREFPDGPAWVAYVTTDDVAASGPVRARLETSAFWGNGIVVAPLLSTVATLRAVPLVNLVPERTFQRLYADPAATRLTVRSPRVEPAPAIASSAPSG